MNYPHLVVAVICQDNDKILMVEELDNGIKCWNQPAGHVDDGECAMDAAIREALEETGYHIELTSLMGVYQGIHKTSGTHYVRVCFHAKAIEKVNDTLDSDIIRAQWLPLSDLLNGQYTLRSDLTRQNLEDLKNAPTYPLSLLSPMVSNSSHEQ